VTASTSALVADVSKAKHYGTSLGVLSSIMDVGHASGPIVTGFVLGALHYAGTYRALAGLMVVAMLVFLALTGGVQREIGAAVEADDE
jgi:DHA1 family multidrug resistance protein-like MFS transporter